MALGFFPDALILDARVRSQLLWEERSVCIARAGHPAIRGRLSLKQFAAAEHVAVFYKRQGVGVIDTLLAQKGYARRTAIAVPHFTTVPFLVADSDFIATIPERLARKFARPLRLQVLASPVELPLLRLTLVWHERFHADPAHQWLRRLIEQISGRGRRRMLGHALRRTDRPRE
jgi:DNA-binding transcriptional LysR family regulator